MVLYNEIVHQPTKIDSITVQIGEDTKYNPYFKDCLDALNSTHLPIYVPLENCALFFKGKRFLSQNMLGVCTFDLKFSYVLLGGEGSAYDDRVLESVIYNHKFKISLGKYFLAVAGYYNINHFIFQYCSLRYHLKEQITASFKLTTKNNYSICITQALSI